MKITCGIADGGVPAPPKIWEVFSKKIFMGQYFGYTPLHICDLLAFTHHRGSQALAHRSNRNLILGTINGFDLKFQN